MKKFEKIIFCLFVLFSFCTIANAACNNEELNEWATKVEPKFVEIKDLGLEASKYAYLLSVTPLRDDITIKVIDGDGASAEAKMIKPSYKDDDILAVGCYTNLEEETYTIEVYGSKDSACPKQLLKTLKYTVPRFNRYLKDQRCENSDSELCQTFTNSTKDMTQDEFDKALKKEINDESDQILSKILKAIINYGLYVIIPLAIVSVFYIIRIKKYKKEERDR